MNFMIQERDGDSILTDDRRTRFMKISNRIELIYVYAR